MKSLERRKRTADLKIRYHGSKKDVYNSLIKSGYFLPEIKSTCVTREYLRKYQNHEVPTVKTADVLPLKIDINLTTLDLFCYYSMYSNSNFGFSISRLPPKEWFLLYCVKVFPRDAISKSLVRLSEHYDTLDDQLIEDIDTKNILGCIKYELGVIKNRCNNFKIAGARALPRLKTPEITMRMNNLIEKYPFLKKREMIEIIQ